MVTDTVHINLKPQIWKHYYSSTLCLRANLWNQIVLYYPTDRGNFQEKFRMVTNTVFINLKPQV
jgi:hypothetical protein